MPGTPTQGAGGAQRGPQRLAPWEAAQTRTIWRTGPSRWLLPMPTGASQASITTNSSSSSEEGKSVMVPTPATGLPLCLCELLPGLLPGVRLPAFHPGPCFSLLTRSAAPPQRPSASTVAATSTPAVTPTTSTNSIEDVFDASDEEEAP